MNRFGVFFYLLLMIHTVARWVDEVSRIIIITDHDVYSQSPSAAPIAIQCLSGSGKRCYVGGGKSGSGDRN